MGVACWICCASQQGRSSAITSVATVEVDTPWALPSLWDGVEGEE